VTARREQTVVHLIAAARPNFMKIAPLYHALKREAWCTPRIVHTGQHYDPNMSDTFFRDLLLPVPEFHLEVGSGSHAEQTGGVMIAYEKILKQERPDWIVVVGDVNSTAACAIVGTKAWIPVVHLEAGLRSGDRRMPEEINRLVTDAIADVLWTPSRDADEHLVAEGVDPSRIDFVGNIMIDSYEMLRPAIEASDARQRLGLKLQAYAVVTLHRPSNVDDAAALRELVAKLEAVTRELPLLFAVHPRTMKKLQEFGLAGRLEGNARICITEPLGYIEFMNVVLSARAVITDSGGVQEETTYLGVPCLTLRENTERPITVTEGTNRLVKPGELVAMIESVLAGVWPKGRRPERWDGRAADRCVAALRKRSSGLRTGG
jgi:UDP-N-acetylglucosamine 2-epimerase (non-hydrolysing)